MHEPENPEPRPFAVPPREGLAVLAIVALALALMGGLIALFWKPAPPKMVVMSTGPADGAYHAFGLQYQQILARSGIQLVLLPSSGALQNLQRLRTRQDGVSLALLQGGIAQPGDGPALFSLGGMFYEPVWVFSRGSVALGGLADLAHQRVAVGVAGSGTQRVARALLDQTAAPGAIPSAIEIGGLAAARALLAGEVDAAIFVSAPDAPAVQLLLREPAIRLLDFQRAEAYVRHFPYLSQLELPEGAIDLARNLPARTTRLVAPTASLVGVDDLHPVIVDLMLAAARQVHGRGSVLWRTGEFPSPQAAEFPLSSDAERFYKTGPSALQRYLPFWAVVWIQRVVFLGLPILAIGIPLLRFMPMLYRWGMRRRIYRWYGELAFIERSLTQGQGQGDRPAQLRRLDDIEGRVNGMRIPPAYASEAYMLKMHLQMVRGRLQATPLANAQLPAAPAV